MGIPFLQAPTEGEAQAAAMVQKGDARYVVSQDYDTLLFGTPTLVRNLTVSGKRKIRGRIADRQPGTGGARRGARRPAPDREQRIEIGILVGLTLTRVPKAWGQRRP